MKRILHGLALAATLFGATATFASDAYPSKPIRMIVAFAAGGSADINARIVGRQLAQEIGGTIIIENKGGAGGNIGAVEVKRAAPDGYTLFYATSAIVLAPSLYANPGFDPYADFTPISLTATIPLALVVSPNVPAKTLPEFIAWLKAQSGKVNYASSGTGALLHLAGELFLKETGTKAVHVPYRGSAPAIGDLIGGSTQFMFLPLNEAIGQVEGGKLRALAVTTEKRVAQMANVPTIREATGITTVEAGAWQGLVVPKGTSAEIVAKLTNALSKTLKDEKTVSLLVAQGSIILGGSAQDYAAYMKAEGDRWARIVKETGAKAE
jgi:tripartite-type tricarboxylate transporter receptor subunit TctC